MFKSFFGKKLFKKNLLGRTRKLESTQITPSTRWSIGIYAGNSIYDLDSPGKNINPVFLTVDDIRDENTTLVADPFMIQKDGKWYLFFEAEVETPGGPIGKIGLQAAGTAFHGPMTGWSWKNPFTSPILMYSTGRENYYMIPETHSVRSVRLYKAREFPHKWELEKILLKGKRFADNSLFKYNNLWWLFTDSGNHTLRLYFSDKPDGKWKEHCKSPIMKKNPNHARPGGRVVLVDGHPVRFAQDAYPVYSSQVWAFKIVDLTAKTYKEIQISTPVIKGSGSGWNVKGMHTVDPHTLEDGSILACEDGLKMGDSSL